MDTGHEPRAWEWVIPHIIYQFAEDLAISYKVWGIGRIWPEYDYLATFDFYWGRVAAQRGAFREAFDNIYETRKHD